MYAPRVLLWAAGAGGLALAVVFFRAGALAPGIACLVLALTAPGAAEVYADRRKRRDWFTSESGTSGDLRGQVDTDALRRLRDEKGTAAAVRDLRKQYPLLPLAEAARLVREA